MSKATVWVSPLYGDTGLFLISDLSFIAYYTVQFLQMEASVLQPSGRSWIRMLGRERIASGRLLGTLGKEGLWLSLRMWLLIYTQS